MLFFTQYVGPALTKKRERAGLTIEELAKRTRISASMICRYETGTSIPPIDKAFKLNNVLDDIIDRKENPDNYIDEIGYISPEDADFMNENGDFWE